MTFTIAMRLEFDSRQVEVDFLALRRAEWHDLAVAPELIIGEAKSVGKGPLIKSHDLARLKAVAAKIPGAIVVISVLRDHFLPIEKSILEPFVKWGRRLNADGGPTNAVVLLTSNELMFDDCLSATWTDLGGRYEKFGTDDHTRNMQSIADATQQIYLGLPSFYQWRRSLWEKKMKRPKEKLRPSKDDDYKPIIPSDTPRETIFATDDEALR